MALIGFKRNDVKVGGQYFDQFYNKIVLDRTKRKTVGGFLAVEWDDLTYAQFKAAKDNIKWRNLALFVELPVSFKTSNVPTWLPNRTYVVSVDEETGEETTAVHTIESWGGIVRENLAGTKMVVRLTKFGDLLGADMDGAIAFIDGAATRTGLLVDEARTLLNGAAYSAPEE